MSFLLSVYFSSNCEWSLESVIVSFIVGIIQVICLLIWVQY